MDDSDKKVSGNWSCVMEWQRGSRTVSQGARGRSCRWPDEGGSSDARARVLYV
jgi:hypothetical protein